MRVSGGTVYLRGKTWTVGYTVDGRRVRESVGSNKKLAEMVLKKRVTEAIENRYFDKRNVGVTPFAEFAEIYNTRHISLLKSVKSETDRVEFWKREFGNRPIGEITHAELQDWQARKRQANKPATVNRIMCRLRHMLNKAVDWDLLDESPMTRLKFLPENNARLRYLSMDECSRLVESCLTPHMRAMATLALHTGMRRGEIFSLEWRDLDFASGHILIRDSKNGEPRHIPMDSTVRELLCGSDGISTPGTGHVFPGASGGRHNTVQKAFRNARNRAGLPDLHFHDLRHTFASHWMMNGGDLYVLKEILGHKSVAMTQRYAHLSPAYKRAMVDKMEAIWAKTSQADLSPKQGALVSQTVPRHKAVTSDILAASA